MDILPPEHLEAVTGIQFTPQVTQALGILKRSLEQQNCSIDAIFVATPNACEDFCFEYLGVTLKVKKTA